MQPRLTLLAHASTRDLRAATFGGEDSIDAPGRTAAEKAAGTLPPADRCLCGPALRCRQTAAALGLTPTPDPRLDDCNYGRWTGLRFQQVLVREPRRLIAWLRDPSTAPHGGESVPQLLERAAALMASLIGAKGHTVAITHAAIVRAALTGILGAPPAGFWRIDVPPLTYADLRTNGRRWVLRSLAPL